MQGSTKNPDKRPSCDTHSVPAGARDAAPGALADVSAAQHTSADTPAGTHSDGPVHTDDATADADAALAVGYADLTMDFPTFSDDDDGDGGASQAAQASQDGPALGHDRIRSATLADDTEVPDAAYSDTQPPGADGGDNADTPTPGPEAATHAPSNGLSLDDEAVPQNGAGLTGQQLRHAGGCLGVVRGGGSSLTPRCVVLQFHTPLLIFRFFPAAPSQGQPRIGRTALLNCQRAEATRAPKARATKAPGPRPRRAAMATLTLAHTPLLAHTTIGPLLPKGARRITTTQ